MLTYQLSIMRPCHADNRRSRESTRPFACRIPFRNSISCITNLDVEKAQPASALLDGLEAVANDPIVADTQCRTTVRLNEQAHAIDELITQRMDLPERPDSPALSVRTAPLGGACLQRPIRLNAIVLNTCQALLA